MADDNPEFADDKHEEGIQNPFDEALTRIAQSKKRGRIQGLNKKQAKEEAGKLVTKMRDLFNSDYYEILQSRPAMKKAVEMDLIVKTVNRRNFGQFFLDAGGLEQLAFFLKPLQGVAAERSAPPVNVVKGVLACLQSLQPYLSAEMIKKFDIGALVREVMKDASQPKELRQAAQEIVTCWVTMVVHNKRTAGAVQSLNEDIDDEDDLDPDEKRAKMNNPGGLSSHAGATVDANGQLLPQVKKSEAELSLIWQPTAEMQKEFDKRMTKRHAMMPMEKPVFHQASLPVSLAPPKRKNKEDPNTGYGKIENQLQRITNPNKNQWRSQNDAVSVSGNNITYKW